MTIIIIVLLRQLFTEAGKRNLLLQQENNYVFKLARKSEHCAHHMLGQKVKFVHRKNDYFLINSLYYYSTPARVSSTSNH